MSTLAALRARRGLSQQALADRSGVHQTTIAGIEVGRHKPRVGTLQKLADALDVEIADIHEPLRPPRSDKELREFRAELEQRIETDLWDTALKPQTDRVLRNLMLRIRDELEHRDHERTKGKEQWTASKK